VNEISTLSASKGKLTSTNITRTPSCLSLRHLYIIALQSLQCQYTSAISLGLQFDVFGSNMIPFPERTVLLQHENLPYVLVNTHLTIKICSKIFVCMCEFPS
jgi:hypothetical protein